MLKVQTSEYITKDLSLAAALKAHQQELIRTEKVNNVFWFIFADKKTCERLAHEYFYGDLQVNSRRYQQEIRQLKNIIFTQ